MYWAEFTCSISFRSITGLLEELNDISLLTAEGANYKKTRLLVATLEECDCYWTSVKLFVLINSFCLI